MKRDLNLSQTLSSVGLLTMLLTALFVLQACSDDDDSGPTGEANVRLVKVDATEDKFYIKNFGNVAQNVSDFWICNLKSYAQLNTLTSDDLNLDPDEMIEISRSLDDDASDVGLYSTNSFASAEAMVDFMQYGEDVGTDGRVDVAVAKGIWTAGEFVPDGSPYEYTGNGTQNGASVWSGTPVAGEANVRILKVDATTDEITLKNFGTAAADISTLFICNRITYAPVGDLTTDDLTLDPDETIVLNRPLEDTSSDVGLYANNSNFGSADNMIDFMQYGEDLGAGGRVNVAVTKGIWTAGEFVADGSPFDYTGDGTQNGASFWSGTTAPNVRIFQVNALTDQITLKNFGTAASDISTLFICNRITYAPVSNLTTDDLTLDPDETIVLNRPLDDTSSDVGLYANNTNFGSADNMIDFMQYGEDLGASGRVNVAVTKGIWAAGEFVDDGSPFDYTGDGTQNGANFWFGTVMANIRLLKVDATTDQITLKNFGNAAMDISGFFICNRITYAPISDLTMDDLTLDPNETIILNRPLDDTSSDVGLYANNNNFGSADNMIDFMQYGEDLGGSGRVSVAVTRGIWTAGEFVSGGSPYDYGGNGAQNGAGEWTGN